MAKAIGVKFDVERPDGLIDTFECHDVQADRDGVLMVHDEANPDPRTWYAAGSWDKVQFDG